MNNREEMIEQLIELKESIAEECISVEPAVSELNNLESRCKELLPAEASGKAGSLKSLMILFNVTNFSDVTVLLCKNDSKAAIIEETGNVLLCRGIEELINDDPGFYNGLEQIEIGGSYYRVFTESMITGASVYTMLSLTSSRNFRSTRFHILCDIVMDYIRSSLETGKGVYGDLFDYTVTEVTKFISLFEEKDPVVFFFRFEYISEFFSRIGLGTLIEITYYIKDKLTELFGGNVSIIRLSLSSYVVVAPHEDGHPGFGEMITRKRINFSFKGILLPYTVVQVPYKKENSIYDIFENVNLMNNYLRTGDIRI